VKHDFLERDASSLPKQPVLFGAPGEVLHSTNVVQRVPFVNTRLTVRWNEVLGGLMTNPEEQYESKHRARLLP
jgi:hypothetical protein